MPFPIDETASEVGQRVAIRMPLRKKLLERSTLQGLEPRNFLGGKDQCGKNEPQERLKIFSDSHTQVPTQVANQGQLEHCFTWIWIPLED